MPARHLSLGYSFPPPGQNGWTLCPLDSSCHPRRLSKSNTQQHLARLRRTCNEGDRCLPGRGRHTSRRCIYCHPPTPPTSPRVGVGVGPAPGSGRGPVITGEGSATTQLCCRGKPPACTTWRPGPSCLAAAASTHHPPHHVALLLFTSWIHTSLPHHHAVTSHSHSPSFPLQEPPFLSATSISPPHHHHLLQDHSLPILIRHALHPPTNLHTLLSVSPPRPNPPPPSTSTAVSVSPSPMGRVTGRGAGNKGWSNV